MAEEPKKEKKEENGIKYERYEGDSGWQIVKEK